MAFVPLSKLDIRVLEWPILPPASRPEADLHASGILPHTAERIGWCLESSSHQASIIGQIWGFLAPALYAHERRA